MQIAYTIAPGRGQTNLLLAEAAKRLAAKGLRLCGTVQTDTECEGQGRCDMDVQVLPVGPVFRISQSLGSEATGCRLDAGTLERAVGLTETRLTEGADLLIVNKFGRHEAEGRGFRNAIGEALSLGIPVIAGANPLNEAALVEFCGGDVTRLEPTLEAILDWATATPS